MADKPKSAADSRDGKSTSTSSRYRTNSVGETEREARRKISDLEAHLSKEKANAHSAQVEAASAKKKVSLLRKELDEMKAANQALKISYHAAETNNRDLKNNMELTNKQYQLLAETKAQLDALKSQMNPKDVKASKHEEKILTLTTERNDLIQENQHIKVQLEQLSIMIDSVRRDAQKSREEADRKIAQMQQQLSAMHLEASPEPKVGNSTKRSRKKDFPKLPEIPTTPADTPPPDYRSGFFGPVIHTPQANKNLNLQFQPIDRPPQNSNQSRDSRATNNTQFNSQQATNKLPPPVIIDKEESWTVVRSRLVTNNIKFVKAQTLPGGIKIFPETPSDYRKLVKLLKDSNKPFHTYTLEEDKIHQTVIRGLLVNMDIEEIKEDLINQGVTDAEVIQLTHPRTKTAMPLFLVKTKDDSRIKSVNRRLDLVIRKEPKKRSRRREAGDQRTPW